MRGRPNDLYESDECNDLVRMESERYGRQQVYFNRGITGSQVYIRKFANKRPDDIGAKAYKWLSRGLIKAIIYFIRRAKGPKWAILSGL